MALNLWREPWRKHLTAEEAAELRDARWKINHAKAELAMYAKVSKLIIMRARARMLRAKSA